MITIRNSKNASEPTLIGFEATLTTASGVYEFSSDGPVADSTSPFGGGLYGAITWPRSRFEIRRHLAIEQQMFVSHDTADIALSWELRGQLSPVKLLVRPYFAGCAPRNYRDVGFHFDSDEEGGRLVWLPNVCGSKIIADTNGQYTDEPVRLAGAIAQSIPSSEPLIVPGRFEFELKRSPSVLIFSSEGRVKSQGQQFVGAFLARLMQRAPDGVGLNPAPTIIERRVAA
jgi:hypothetical protein